MINLFFLQDVHSTEQECSRKLELHGFEAMDPGMKDVIQYHLGICNKLGGKPLFGQTTSFQTACLNAECEKPYYANNKFRGSHCRTTLECERPPNESEVSQRKQVFGADRRNAEPFLEAAKTAPLDSFKFQKNSDDSGQFIWDSGSIAEIRGAMVQEITDEIIRRGGQVIDLDKLKDIKTC